MSRFSLAHDKVYSSSHKYNVNCYEFAFPRHHLGLGDGFSVKGKMKIRTTSVEGFIVFTGIESGVASLEMFGTSGVLIINDRTVSIDLISNTLQEQGYRSISMREVERYYSEDPAAPIFGALVALADLRSSLLELVAA